MVPKELLAALRQIEIHTSHLANDALAGTYTSVFRGQGMVFREVRPYMIGDDIRRIDWNVSARMGQPFVKLFTEEREMTVMLLVDVSQSHHFGSQRAYKSRLAAEVAALLAFSAIKNGDRVGLVMATDRIERIVPPKKGERHVLRVAREVLGFEPEGHGTDMTSGLEALTRLSKRRSVAFVISDFFLPQNPNPQQAIIDRQKFERTLALAAAKHDIVAIELLDPRDDQLPDVGLAMLEDFESGDEVLIDTSSARVRRDYETVAKERRLQLRSVFRKLAVDHVQISTAGSFVQPLRDLFARRARRARRGGL